jgi:hypothetical protein
MRTRAAEAPAVADALFSATQRRVLGLLFGEPDREFFATELIALAAGGSGAVQRELARLVAAGLVTLCRAGNRKLYQANRRSLAFHALRALVHQALAVPGAIAAALEPVRSDVELALLYEPASSAADDCAAALDLLVVSDVLSPDTVGALLAPVQAQLGCPVNLPVCTATEFRLRAARPNTAVARVLAGPNLVVIGRVPD